MLRQVASSPPCWAWIRNDLRAVNYDRNVFISLACVLLGFGTLMVQSASVTSWPTEFEQIYLGRHVTFLSLGAAAASVCALLPARFWFRIAPWLFVLSLSLLVCVLVPSIGTEVNGARRWLRYGPVSLQPSELAKLTLPLFLGRLIVLRRDRLNHWFHGTVPLLLPVVMTAPLIACQPDFGTAVFLGIECGIVLFIAGWPMRNFLVSGGLCTAAAVHFLDLKPYQFQRITGFLAAWSDLDQAPYQLKQSLVSFGAGGLFGVGLGKGWQKLSFLPEANTDFVFAVIGEELGLMGTLTLLALWVGLYIAGLRLLRHLPRFSYSFLAGTALLSQLLMQAFLNMAVATALVPPKGISLPLLSYGGSNLVVSMVALGLVVSFSKTGRRAVDGHTS